MPTFTSGDELTEVDLNNVACKFAFTMDKQVVYGLIGATKFKKHILPVDLTTAKTKESAKVWTELKWGVINPEGNLHTALAPKGFGAIRPLFEFFARDFIREFRKKPSYPLKGELRYTKEELARGVPVPRGLLVLNKTKVRRDVDGDAYHFLRVGAIVKKIAAREITQSSLADQKKPDEGIVIVYFQHGPLVE